jgi:hypothetical protein
MEKILDQIRVTGSHEEIGLAIGRRFRENIVTAFDAVGDKLSAVASGRTSSRHLMQ